MATEISDHAGSAGPSSLAARSYRCVRGVSGPLLFVTAPPDARYGATVVIELADGREVTGQIIELTEEQSIIQVLGDTTGVDVARTRVNYAEAATTIGVSEELLGRSFDGAGRPRDGLPAVSGGRQMPVNGAPINPVARRQPDAVLHTGVSAIDGLNTLVRGQKLPVFAGAGLPAQRLISTIVDTLSTGEEQRALVFCGIGITHREASEYAAAFAASGNEDRLVSFLNRADDPTAERLLAPRCALTVAEHLAFTLGYHVLVVMIDMTNYCEALRQVGTAREEVPGRRGYPGYMYTDLASLYERAGCVQGDGAGAGGTLTQLPILTVPDDDLTHPIADLTGYITEGQIVLSRDLHRSGVFPPIDVLPSLSRLMNRGIGKGKTRDDHRGLADQLYAVYARGRDLRRLVAIMGEDALSPLEQRYLAAAERFERELVNQQSARSIEQTLELGWALLRELPREQLTRVGSRSLDEHYPAPEQPA